MLRIAWAKIGAVGTTRVLGAVRIASVGAMLVCNARLRLVRADQSGAVDDLAAANLPLGVAGSSSYPAWSPSGRTLAFTRRIVTGRHDAYNRRPADAYIAPFDPVTGTVGPGVPVPGQNTFFVERTPVFIP